MNRLSSMFLLDVLKASFVLNLALFSLQIIHYI